MSHLKHMSPNNYKTPNKPTRMMTAPLSSTTATDRSALLFLLVSHISQSTPSRRGACLTAAAAFDPATAAAPEQSALLVRSLQAGRRITCMKVNAGKQAEIKSLLG